MRHGKIAADPDVLLLGYALSERDLSFALERGYRELARRATSSNERIRLVDRANEIRPRTWT